MSEATGIRYQTLINLYLRDCRHQRRRLSMEWRASAYTGPPNKGMKLTKLSAAWLPAWTCRLMPAPARHRTRAPLRSLSPVFGGPWRERSRTRRQDRHRQVRSAACQWSAVGYCGVSHTACRHVSGPGCGSPIGHVGCSRAVREASGDVLRPVGRSQRAPKAAVVIAPTSHRLVGDLLSRTHGDRRRERWYHRPIAERDEASTMQVAHERRLDSSRMHRTAVACGEALCDRVRQVGTVWRATKRQRRAR